MSKTRPPYPAEFRQQIVELAATGKTPKELSDEFGVSAQTVVNWVGASKAGVTVGAKGKQSSRSVEQEEIARLRRELKRVQMERDILAKATAWFAANNDKTSTPSTKS